MRLHRALPAAAAITIWSIAIWAISIPAAPLWAQSAFDQLEQQVRRDNAQDAARQGASGTPAQEPGYLGVIAEDRQGDGKGLNVIEVIAGAPAERAGLKAGDFITSIDSQPVHSMQDFERILSVAPAGKTLAFQYTRAGQSQKAEVTLVQRPPPGQRRFEQFGHIPQTVGQPPAEARGGTLGVKIASVTPELQRSLALPGTSGALVVSIIEGSAAAQAGIVAGNVMLSVDGQRVETPADLSRLISQAGAGREVTLGYYNGTANVERKVVLGGAAPAQSSASPPVGEGPAGPQVPPPAGGLVPGQPLSGQFGAADGQFGGAPGQYGAAPGPFGGLPGQLGPPPGQFGAAPNQFGAPGEVGGDPSSAAVDRIHQLEQRVIDLERRVRELEQWKNQTPPAHGTQAAQSRDQQT